ncbi:MAG TPA: glucose-6-phosphate isomerase [Streptosporangiaceae bacterium]|nr:glucose-6-phosphate isomerase [Streptosporangiaceae bacterium]
MSTLAVAAAGVSVQTRSLAATEATKRAAAKLIENGVPAKLTAKDPGLWGPAAEPVAATGLGWLDAPAISRRLLGEFAQLAERVRQDRLEHIVLAGMGGSSLAPEVITHTAGAPLTVLDTSDPHQVASALGDRLDRTLVIVSSKSGSTIETDSHRRIYEHALHDLGLKPEEVARRFVIVTDPGSPLEAVARKAGYHVVLADPNVGGRYSALTAFGLAPSAIAGVDVAELLDQAAAVMPTLGGDDDNPGLALGAALGGFAVEGHDKAVLADHDSGISGFGDWAEQLLAESTGKQGLGILPVVVESADAPGFSPGPDIHLVALGSPAPPGADNAAAPARAPRPVDTVAAGPLGAQFMVWEYATALAGRIIGINPFDQPNVHESKDITGALLAGAGDGPLPVGQAAFVDGMVEVHADPERLRGATDLAGVLDSLIWSLPDRGYLAIMAYLDRISDSDAANLRTAVAVRTTHPVTFGWGPRLLHSTGQFHKGGPQTGVFLQITGAIERDVQVPDAPYSLGRLQLAQALGDLSALRGRGRPAVRLHLRNRGAGLAQLLGAATGTACGPVADGVPAVESMSDGRTYGGATTAGGME